MNTNKIKTYAPKARRDFIAAVTRRAGTFGLTAKGTSPVREEGQLVFIEGQPYPRSVGAQRQKLAARVTQHGFERTMEAAAYTWFNRLIAIRSMELHGYLDHSFRVLSHPAGQALPEVLGHAEHLDLPGLDRERVITLKMDGTRDEELYRDLLLAQCRALHRAMPFLFEPVDDETELLLPDNLLQTDSLISDLVSTIPEEDWQEVEIIGWLYQFYISEKKDQVIGKVVKSEDIPAATQLFTPNWIVQYLVQNSVGRLWLMANPASALKGEWPYYIEPAEQTPEVQAQLDALIASRCLEEVDSGKWIVDSGGEAASPPSDYPLSTIHYPLNPETITVLDPACGSGHILVVAYDVLKAIYLERGYRPRDIPRLILEKNLYGLDIDDRAAQLAGFALLMKARADDRRLLDDPPRLNVLALQESKGLNADELTRSLQPIAAIVGRVSPEGVTRQQAAGFAEDDLFPDTLPQMSLSESLGAEASGYAALTRPTIAALIDTFAEAKTFGSLIQIPPTLAKALPEMETGLLQALDSGDVFARTAADDLLPLVRQAHVLAMRFDAVVANPPYMGGKFLTPNFKKFVANKYDIAKGDLYTCFIIRNIDLVIDSGIVGMITIPNWMFLSSYEGLRSSVLSNGTIETMSHNGRGAFGSDFGSCAFTLRKGRYADFVGSYKRLFDKQGSVASNRELMNRFLASTCHAATSKNFEGIPGAPIAYWASRATRKAFENELIGDIAQTRKGMVTANNDIFVRTWPEISLANVLFSSDCRETAKRSERRWFPYITGGEYRKWYGNRYDVVNWYADGSEIRTKMHPTEDRVWATNFNMDFIFRPNVNWNSITAAKLAFRASPGGELFASTGLACFIEGERLFYILGFLNSKVCESFLSIVAPTLSANPGDIGRLPILPDRCFSPNLIPRLVKDAIRIAKDDWDSFESSWDFESLPVTESGTRLGLLSESWKLLDIRRNNRISELKAIEEEINQIYIVAYGQEGELVAQVSYDYIALARADRQKDCQHLISYAIGCMMGRYRLDRPGLIYAHSGNQNFEAIYNAVKEESTDDTDEHRLRNEHLCSSVSSVDKSPFPPDADGIVPITDTNWFDDDAPNRVREFLLAVWGTETLNENMSWLAESLGQKSGETPDETIRRYLSTGFFKDHLQTYKRRPIYWCFSSGKQKAFEALVYLHRYHEGTLARMRMEYVVPLQGKMAARIDRLVDDIASASTTAQAKRLQKERDKLTRQLDELRRYDEQLRHYADQRIALDLDDGVKVNYGKFGNLLAEVKTVTGAGAD